MVDSVKSSKEFQQKQYNIFFFVNKHQYIMVNFGNSSFTTVNLSVA